MKPVISFAIRMFVPPPRGLDFWPRARQRCPIFFERRRRLFIRRHRGFWRHRHCRLSHTAPPLLSAGNVLAKKKNLPAVVFALAGGSHLESSHFHPFLLTYRKKDGCFGSYFVHSDVPNHGSDFWFRISLEPNVSTSRERLTVSLYFSFGLQGLSSVSIIPTSRRIGVVG